MLTRIAGRIRFPKKKPQQTIFLVGHNNIFPHTHTLTHTYLCTVDVECAHRRRVAAELYEGNREKQRERESEKGGRLAFIWTFFLAPGPNICLAPNARRRFRPHDRSSCTRRRLYEILCLYTRVCMYVCVGACSCGCAFVCVRTSVCVCMPCERVFIRAVKLAIQFTRATRSSGCGFYIHCRVQVV